ncbi:hypothetical protein GX50_06960 [[Emmonsia] crescens]|uniref:Uncharacterized protein n=1 Tax=[Emmonsia] crescens TaxID=73230 RepID=A0A2B7ZAQ3_9EURO|nr:hypothetical protein GX50_06960 [Emmonsia crescens]
MSQPKKLELTEERLAMHNKTYKPSPVTHSRHASQLVAMERISMGCLDSATDFPKNEQHPLLYLSSEPTFCQTSDSFPDLFERENKRLHKSPLEHPLERLLTPGDLSEPICFSTLALKEYGFEYGSRASVDARKKLGRLNYESTKLNARAARTVDKTCGNRKR